MPARATTRRQALVVGVRRTGPVLPLAQDGFAVRNVSNGWGMADTSGGAWSVPVGSASLFQVGGNAQVALDGTGATEVAELAGAVAATCRIQYELSLSALPSAGNFVYVFAGFRMVDPAAAFYRVGVFIDSAGTPCLRGETVPAAAQPLFADSTPVGAPTLAAGTHLIVAAELLTSSTTTVMAKLWAPATQGDPGWEVLGTDDTNTGPQMGGPIGLRLSSTVDPITVSIYNFQAVIV